jgi:hypothetical protein
MQPVPNAILVTALSNGVADGCLNQCATSLLHCIAESTLFPSDSAPGHDGRMSFAVPVPGPCLRPDFS